MPSKPPRICGCGHKIASGTKCPCERERDKDRKAKHDKKRPSSSSRGYNRKWENERKAFLKVNVKCRKCPARATVVDHIVPHKGDDALFWNKSNWQALCVTCHSSTKQRQERANETR